MYLLGGLRGVGSTKVDLGFKAIQIILLLSFGFKPLLRYALVSRLFVIVNYCLY
jgi:hypothetical protein